MVGMFHTSERASGKSAAYKIAQATRPQKIKLSAP